MAKLIFLLDGNILKEYLLDKERMTIGRRPSNDIYIDNLAVSGEHALLVTVDGESSLEDLNSTNGTLVNQKPVKKQVLKHGDEIGLGKYTLKFLSDNTVNAPPSNGFSDTVLVTPEPSANNTNNDVTTQEPDIAEAKSGESESEAVKPSEENVLASEPQEPSVETDKQEAAGSGESIDKTVEGRGPHLQTLNGEDAGAVLLLDKSMVKVGLPGEQVAVVTKRQDAYFITHVAGEHYPLVNSEQIGAQAHALSNDDEVEVMGIKMVFHLD